MATTRAARARLGRERREPLVEAASRDQLHAEKMPPPIDADFVDRNDVWMVELRDGLGLVLKSHPFGLGSEAAGLDHLESNVALERDLASPVHNPHAPVPQLVQDVIAGDVRRVLAAGELLPWLCQTVRSGLSCPRDGRFRRSFRIVKAELDRIGRRPSCLRQPATLAKPALRAKNRGGNVAQVWKSFAIRSQVGLLAARPANLQIEVQEFAKQRGSRPGGAWAK